MKLSIICIGRLKDDAERILIERYRKRLDQIGGTVGIGPCKIIEIPESRARSEAERKVAEAAAIRQKMAAGAYCIALDERGKPNSSAEFARQLGHIRDNGLRDACFLIGGADGLEPVLRDKANMRLSFGRMTMPHGLIRVILCEQLYRAATILAGHPYHRE